TRSCSCVSQGADVLSHGAGPNARCRLLYSRPAAPHDLMRTVPSVALICLALTACASVPNAHPPAPASPAPCAEPAASAGTTPPAPPLPVSLANNLRPAAWSDLPGWGEDSVLD